MSKQELKPGERWSSEENYVLPDELLEEFHNKVMALAEEMFGRDCDGDLPVNVRVIDRTRYEPNHYFCIEYRHKLEKQPNAAEALENRLDLLLGNLQIASEDVDRELRFRKIHGRKNPNPKKG